MLPVDRDRNWAPVIGLYHPTARHRYHGVPRHAGDRTRCVSERHMPAERRVIMTEYRQFRSFGQPWQQRLGTVDLDQLGEMHRGRHRQAASHPAEQRFSLLPPTCDSGCLASGRQDRHLVRVDEQHVVPPQLGFSHGPMGSCLSLSRVVHPDNDHPEVRLLHARGPLTQAIMMVSVLSLHIPSWPEWVSKIMIIGRQLSGPWSRKTSLD
jgi:hypothetical protein